MVRMDGWTQWTAWTCCLLIVLGFPAIADERPWPALPAENGSAELPAQAWTFQAGPRTVTAYVYYPGGTLANVNAQTGLFLSLHNWGGAKYDGAPDPLVLAERYNVIAICVDYLQSGPYDAATMPPYDFGYLQALDALRALYWVRQGLIDGGHAHHDGRIYATGGSGGGNVTLMANKLAPRTFAAIVDMCGMAKLSDDIAFGLEGASPLNAGYSRDPTHPEFLSPDAQALRDNGHSAHLRQMREYGQQTRIFVVHGTADNTCPVEDKRGVVRKMRAVGMPVTALFVEDKHLDGEALKSTGHSLGDRTKILQRVADAVLLPDSKDVAVRQVKTDFERGEVIRYETMDGQWEIDYAAGFPVGRFVAGKR